MPVGSLRSEPTGTNWLTPGRDARTQGSPGGIVHSFKAAEALNVGDEVALSGDMTVCHQATDPLAVIIGRVVGGKRTKFVCSAGPEDIGQLAATTGQTVQVLVLGIAWKGSAPGNAALTMVAPGAQAIQVPSHPGVGTVSQYLTYLDKSLTAISVKAKGAVGDNVTDDYPAFLAAYNELPDTGGIIDIPFSGIGDSIYYLSHSLVTSKPVYWRAAFSSQMPLDPNRGISLRFAPGQHGFVFDAYNTRAGIPVPDVSTNLAATKSIVEGLRLIGGGIGGAPVHGVYARCRFVARNVEVFGFSQHGFMIEAEVASPTIKGNANCWYLERCDASGCGGDGIHVHGGDANAGLCIGSNTGANVGWDIYDDSFLGNTYVACTTDGGTTRDGVNGGHVWSNGAVSANTFLGCYAEGGLHTKIGAQTTIIGGNISSASTSAEQAAGSVMLAGSFKGAPPRYYNDLSGKLVQISLGIQGANTALLAFGCFTDEGTDSTYILQYNPTYGQYEFAHAGSVGRAPIKLLGAAPATGTPRGYGAGLTNGFYIGGGTDMQTGMYVFGRQIIPGSGEGADGDLCLHTDAGVGEPWAWRKLAGTWRPQQVII